jgi:excisionase family DNA binding protein
MQTRHNNPKNSSPVGALAFSVYESVDSLARELGISRSVAYKGLRTGKIPSIRLNKRFIIPRSAIAEWLRTAGNLKLWA